ncbi:unnamed protein product [Prorocentrum cordatum]|uniref:Uncharacterized protein n=1 Tax=Prorocentrum cordatum TaxID=2364126 RepID=A0ABN9TLJ3_9DINO|nr:unnamed protein product [Polarella glacialis]
MRGAAPSRAVEAPGNFDSAVARPAADISPEEDIVEARWSAGDFIGGGPLDPVVRLPYGVVAELRAAAGLVFLGEVDRCRVPADVAFVTDSSLKGHAVCRACVRPDEVLEATRWKERQRFVAAGAPVDPDDAISAGRTTGLLDGGGDFDVDSRPQLRRAVARRRRVELEIGAPPAALSEELLGPRRWRRRVPGEFNAADLGSPAADRGELLPARYRLVLAAPRPEPGPILSADVVGGARGPAPGAWMGPLHFLAATFFGARLGERPAKRASDVLCRSFAEVPNVTSLAWVFGVLWSLGSSGASSSGSTSSSPCARWEPAGGLREPGPADRLLVGFTRQLLLGRSLRWARRACALSARAAAAWGCRARFGILSERRPEAGRRRPPRVPRAEAAATRQRRAASAARADAPLEGQGRAPGDRLRLARLRPATRGAYAAAVAELEGYAPSMGLRLGAVDSADNAVNVCCEALFFAGEPMYLAKTALYGLREIRGQSAARPHFLKSKDALGGWAVKRPASTRLPPPSDAALLLVMQVAGGSLPQGERIWARPWWPRDPPEMESGVRGEAAVPVPRSLLQELLDDDCCPLHLRLGIAQSLAAAPAAAAAAGGAQTCPGAAGLVGLGGYCVGLVAGCLHLPEVLATRACGRELLQWVARRGAEGEGHAAFRQVRDRMRARLWMWRVAALTGGTSDEGMFETRARSFANGALRARMQADLEALKARTEAEVQQVRESVAHMQELRQEGHKAQTQLIVAPKDMMDK